MITSAYSKSSYSSGFNSIVQKFCEMICEIIVYKTLCGIFLIFCRSSFINNFIVKNHFSEQQNHRNLNISRSIYFLKKLAHRFEDHIFTNKLEEFFFRKIFFLEHRAFFTTGKPLIWASFFPQKIAFILFSSAIF